MHSTVDLAQCNIQLRGLCHSTT